MNAYRRGNRSVPISGLTVLRLKSSFEKTLVCIEQSLRPKISHEPLKTKVSQDKWSCLDQNVITSFGSPCLWDPVRSGRYENFSNSNWRYFACSKWLEFKRIRLYRRDQRYDIWKLKTSKSELSFVYIHQCFFTSETLSHRRSNN